MIVTADLPRLQAAFKVFVVSYDWDNADFSRSHTHLVTGSRSEAEAWIRDVGSKLDSHDDFGEDIDGDWVIHEHEIQVQNLTLKPE